MKDHAATVGQQWSLAKSNNPEIPGHQACLSSNDIHWSFDFQEPDACLPAGIFENLPKAISQKSALIHLQCPPSQL